VHRLYAKYTEDFAYRKLLKSVYFLSEIFKIEAVDAFRQSSLYSYALADTTVDINSDGETGRLYVKL